MSRREGDSDYGNKQHFYDGLTSPQLDAEIIRLTRAGLSQSQVGRRLGLTQQGVSKALKRIKAGRQGRDPRER
jgi:DNA-binding MarR family transcriptional regulator